MANWYVSNVAWLAVTQWAASTVTAVGAIRRQVATGVADDNKRVFRCTTAGTTGGTEPTWVLTKGSTTTDNTVVWTEITGNETYHAPGAWAAPFSALAAAAAWAAGGDSIYCASNHSDSRGVTMTITLPAVLNNPVFVACIDESASGHIPPQPADLKTGATASTTGSNIALGISGVARIQGIIFTSSATGGALTVGASGVISDIMIKDGALRCGGNGSITLGTSGNSGPSRIVLDNVTMQWGSTGGSLAVIGAFIHWKNTLSALTGGTIPTTLFASSVAGGATVMVEGVDLSAAGSGKTLVAAQAKNSIFHFLNCKLNASVVIAATPTNTSSWVTVTNTDSGTASYRSEHIRYSGTQTIETTIVRTGGAAENGTALSWNITPSANAKFLMPTYPAQITVHNGVTGSAVNAAVEGVLNAAALPTNADIWSEDKFMGSSATPISSFVNTAMASPLSTPAAWTASTEAWDSLVTARANSTVYATGNVRKVASNPGRIFFCTGTSGNATSSSTEPAGFASAVDGGSVTDGNVTWRAGVRFKMSTTLTSPQIAGRVYKQIFAALASTTFYIDPVITLS